MEHHRNDEHRVLKRVTPRSRPPINDGRRQFDCNKSHNSSGTMENVTDSSSNYESDGRTSKLGSSYGTSDSQIDTTQEDSLNCSQDIPYQIPNLSKEKMDSNQSPSTIKSDSFYHKYSRNDSSIKPLFGLKLHQSIGILLCCSFIYFAYGHYITNESETKFKVDISSDMLKERIDHIRKQFDQQDPSIWDGILSGLNDVIEHPDTISIFILLSKENDTMNCLAASLGQLSGRVLGTNNYLTLTPMNIGNDTGTVLSALKEKITARKVVVVENLLNINTNALQAFHNLCDRQNPLIEQSVYIITILSDSSDRKRLLPFVEALISNKLSGSVDQDKIAPLVTRITDGIIINVNPQQHMIKCMLNQ